MYVPERDIPSLSDMAELTLRLTEMPDCKIDIGVAQQVVDITPPYWGDEREATYILAMKRNPEAAKLHIIPRDPERPTQAILPDGQLIIGQGSTVHIPAQQEGVGLMRPARRRGQYLAGAVIHLTPEAFSSLQSDFDRINLRNSGS